MKICQVDPACGLSIPPKGWGAIEKIVWEFKCNLEKQGHQIQSSEPVNLAIVMSGLMFWLQRSSFSKSLASITIMPLDPIQIYVFAKFSSSPLLADET